MANDLAKQFNCYLVVKIAMCERGFSLFLTRNNENRRQNVISFYQPPDMWAKMVTYMSVGSGGQGGGACPPGFS